MKKFLAFIFVVAAPLLLFAQGAYITDRLWDFMQNPKNENSRVRILLVMREQVDLQALLDDFEKDKTPLETRQRTVIRMLQHKAATCQKDVVDDLGKYETKHKGSIKNVRSFWITNVITAEIPAKLVWQLAERTDIASIEFEDDHKIYPVKPVTERPDDKLLPGAAETGLYVIGADKMWRMGYTGRNRLGYNVDTGVWPDHPSISDRFLANYFPLSQCWFPFDLEFPGDKTGSHGTHTLGTVMGLDPATHDTVGCAFNAYWIASDPIVTNIADIKPLPVILLAFEWALNPDGDTSTVSDIPDAINNSWGREPATDSSLCDSYASQAFLAVEAAGIAIIFSAGNEGPGPMTIGSPHHISSNIVNLFTVGALNGNQTGYPIASFSSRGPGICGGTGSILIKPEVAAPGVDVRSAVNSNGYAYYSGTSMAGPHATGATLLLKEAFPYLPGSELLKALYFTATDLGDPGEDNTYGMGLIDVENAFNYLSSLYTPVPPDSNAYDAVISSISIPDGIYHCDSTLNPVVVLHNGGDSAITSGIFKYRTLDGSELSEPWTGNLAAGQSQNINLPLITLASGGRKEFTVWFESDTAMHESSVINNRRMARFNFRPPVSLPFIEDFENGISPELWCINNPDQNMTWDTIPAGGLPFSDYSAVMRFSTLLLTGQVDELVTPSFNLSGLDSAKLCFDVAYQNRHPSLTDSLRIFVSTDCGSSFTKIYSKGGTGLQTYDTATANFVPWRSDQWRTEYLDLTPFTGNPHVLIKFLGYNRKGNNLFLDNIKVYSGTEPAGLPNPGMGSWHIYPNPASDWLFVETGTMTEEETELIITDAAGKVHVQKTLQSQASGTISFDISDLPAGFYIIHVRCGTDVFSGKIVKW